VSQQKTSHVQEKATGDPDWSNVTRQYKFNPFASVQYPPKPRAATSVATNIDTFPLRNSETQ